MNENQTTTGSTEYPTLDAIVNEAGKFLNSLGKAATATIEDWSDLMMVTVEKDIRDQLDEIIDAGLAKNRREAAQILMKEGLKNRSGIFEKIQETNAQITELRQQMQNIAKEKE